MDYEDDTSPGGAPSMNAETAAALFVAMFRVRGTPHQSKLLWMLYVT